MIAYTSWDGTRCKAVRITCSSRGLPPTSCNTLGSCDFSLVPLPAAIMAIATRDDPGAVGFDDDGRDKDELFLDFISIPNIPCPRRNGYSAKRTCRRTPPLGRSGRSLQEPACRSMSLQGVVQR